MEQLLGDNLIIIYFIVGLSVICYSNFSTQQRIMLIYTITYASCFLNILDSKVALILMTFLLFIYLEYLTEDYYKLKIIRKLHFKIVDAIFLSIFQYYYVLFACSILLQTDYIKTLVEWEYYSSVCIIISIIMAMFCIHETSTQRFEISSITEIMKIVDKNPVYRFPYNDIDVSKYMILTEIEDKSYFERKNSYNFLSLEFFWYRICRFKDYIRYYHGREKIKRVTYAVGHYALATKHIRGYSTIEMQLMRNIGLQNGYNCVIRRKIFEFVYTKIFFCSLKQYFKDNYYSNRQHFKEYLLWLYFRVVKTKIKGKSFQPVSTVFANEEMETWSIEGLFIACMGLSGKGAEYYNQNQFCKIIQDYRLDKEKLMDMYDNIKSQKLQ